MRSEVENRLTQNYFEKHNRSKVRAKINYYFSSIQADDSDDSVSADEDRDDYFASCSMGFFSEVGLSSINFEMNIKCSTQILYISHNCCFNWIDFIRKTQSIILRV